MAASGARALKPVGSATWISSEKENIMNLVNQEMEEVEFPVRNEMDWLNEHMAEIFSKNQFNLTDAFKTPGKLRGKTPRTARKRNVEESRTPLGEIFPPHNQMESKLNATPADRHANAKLSTPTTTTKDARDVSQPHYPDLAKDMKSSPQPNMDAEYHDAPDDAANSAPPQEQPKSQAQDLAKDLKSSPQPNMDTEYHDTPDDAADSAPPQEQPKSQAQDLAKDLKSSQPNMDTEYHDTPDDAADSAPPQEQPESQAPDLSKYLKSSQPNMDAEYHDAPDDAANSAPPQEQPKSQAPDLAKDLRSSPQPNMDAEYHDTPDDAANSAPSQEQPKSQAPTQDMDLDNLDDIGSPSDGSTPEPAPIRKSSLTFASLPARDPIPTKKSIGGSRISRTSHVDPLNVGRSSYLGRQTGDGHRTTKSITEQLASQPEKMDIDNDGVAKDTDVDSRAGQLHNKSSTQRLHEKISMLGKLQPSRPTKSIPSVARMSSNQVAYPELPSMKTESKPDAPTQHDNAPTIDRMETEAAETRHVDFQNDQNKDVGEKERNVMRTVDESKPDASTEHDNAPMIDRMETGAAETRHVDFQNDQNEDVGEKERDVMKTVEMEEPPAARPQSSGDGQRSRSNTTKSVREKSATPVHSMSEYHHQKSPSVSSLAHEQSTTPWGSPKRYEGPLSSSKSKLQSIMKSAKGLFSNSAGASLASRTGASSPTPLREGSQDLGNDAALDTKEEAQPAQLVQRHPSPQKQEGRRTRSSTEREERKRQEERRQQDELEYQRREEERLKEKAREQDLERQRAHQAKTAQEEAPAEQEEERAAPTPQVSVVIPGPKRAPQQQTQPVREPETHPDVGTKHAAAPASSQQLRKPADRRPVKPTREPTQKTQPQPVSIRVGSALSRQMPLAPNRTSSVQDSNASAPAPAPATSLASASKPSAVRKKVSNASSLQTTSSANSLKSTASSQSQRKAQLASDRKREQEEREVKRKEEQKREIARKRAALQQQQEEARRRERERHAEDPKRAAQMQEIEKRRLMNARRLDKQGGHQPPSELGSQHERTTPGPPQRGDLGSSRPTSRLGSIQSFSRPLHPPAPNPAKPPKRHLDEEADARPAPPKPSVVQVPNESKRRKTEEEYNPPFVRPAMAPPIRQSNIRKEPSKPSIFGHGQHSVSHQAGSSIFKTGPSQTQRPAHPMDMAKYTSSKIPFAETSNPPAPKQHKQPPPPPAPVQKPAPAPPKPSPKYPNGENINLPEIPTDSEDEDSESEILPVPKWAQPKELEAMLRQQDGMETDSIFGPVAPFSLEDTFKSDKKIKKFRDRTSSANWSGTDALTQEEIHMDLAERQRFKRNGGWSMRQ